MRRLLRSRLWAPLLERTLAARALAALRRTGAPPAATLAPLGFARLCRGATPHADFFERAETATLQAVVVRVDRLNEVDPRVLALLESSFALAHLNPLYAVFSRAASRGERGGAERRLRARMAAFAEPEHRGWAPHHPGTEPAAAPGSGGEIQRAAVVTTFNRPGALSRALGPIRALGMPVIVVDDGSDEWARRANREICGRWDAALLAFPGNRGLPAAMNAGLAYLLADPAISWISYFQDDVDVKPALVESLARVEDEQERPLLTGYDAPEHPCVDVVDVGGVSLKRKRSTPAVHLHAHRSYWAAVMPIPSPYLGAPKPLVGASMEDWWITSQAPQSVGKRGLYVGCVPGLVTTFLSHRDDSTWDNPAQP